MFVNQETKMYNANYFYDLFAGYDYVNPWEGTVCETLYYMSPKKRGMIGENIIASLLLEVAADRDEEIDIQPATNAGHDRIINGIKTELKFALAIEANENYQCMFNHIGFDKDWDQIILCCINGDCSIQMTLYTLEEMEEIRAQGYLSRQQGGEKQDNDDWMCGLQSSYDLLFNGEVIIGSKIEDY